MISDQTLMALFATVLAMGFPFWSWSSMLSAVQEQEARALQRERYEEMRREQERLYLQGQFAQVQAVEAARAAPPPALPPSPQPRLRKLPPTMVGIASGALT